MAYDFSIFKKRVLEINDWLLREYSSIRTGRATPLILDNVVVDSYGSKVPVKHVAAINIEDPRTLRITPWDKSQTRALETGIMNANLGLSVIADGEGLRLVFPELTGERREQFVKLVKEKMEEARVSLRKEREKVLSDLNSLSDDEKFKAREELQKLVDKGNADFLTIAEKKEVELRS
ncbi:MAG: ribosome recycling factor [Candidatus Pacebacteria bacterium]|nr:ribosome recycling factor [Candidatus Paceibacterota bacterium]